MAAMGKPGTNVSQLSEELGVTRQTLYRHIGPKGSLRDAGRRLMGDK
jgi:transcriptional regulator of acetoin/glycerol metabolism